MIFENLKLKIKNFPTQSGVYLMKNSADKIIYVGKAKNLKSVIQTEAEKKEMEAILNSF